MVVSSDQRSGSSGAVRPASTSSTGEASSMPSRPRNSCWRAPPIARPMWAAPMFEDLTSTSSTVSRGAVVVEVADGEAAPAHRALGVDPGLRADHAGVERHGDGEGLEGRAELVAALGGAVEERAVGRVAAGRQRRAQVRVEVGQARERADLAGVGLHQDADGALGAHVGHAGREHLLERGLHLDVEREPERLGEAGGVAQAVVEDLLDAGGADDLGGLRPPRGRSWRRRGRGRRARRSGRGGPRAGRRAGRARRGRGRAGAARARSSA